MNQTILVIGISMLAAILLFALIALFLKFRALRGKYLPIIDVEAEVERLKRQLLEDTKSREELNSKYSVAKIVYDRLKNEVSLLEENLEDISFGLYKPHYTFETSDQYKQELEAIWEKKKETIRNGAAVTCPITLTVENSKHEGERMTKQLTKVMLRAFNGECDAAIAKVTWNNITRMEERIRKSHQAINYLETVMKATISPQYLDLCLAELRLTHEYETKKHDEQEEQRHIREQMREEERAQREFERVRQEAIKEQSMYEKMLAKAREEAEKAQGKELEESRERIRELEQKAAEARAKEQRAISNAQKTKQGHVYIISNVGSFGEEVFKIGMTRRDKPEERIDELGDAAVPFPFDIHATIYSEDAPGLENAFHKRFADNRMNLVNARKEYFRASLKDIEDFAKSQGASAAFTKLAEAREYRETLALRSGGVTPIVTETQSAFPDRLPTI